LAFVLGGYELKRGAFGKTAVRGKGRASSKAALTRRPENETIVKEKSEIMRPGKEVDNLFRIVFSSMIR
jgi:hypothetical protein